MKLTKRILSTLLLLATIGLVFRGPIYRLTVSYKSIGQRTAYSALNADLIDYIEKNERDENIADIEEVIKSALSKTSKKLNYTASKNDNDPNLLIYSKTAHCLGYASFYATTCNYLLKKNNLDQEWVARPQVGQLYFLGENIHHYFDSPFFKAHDFVTIENKITSEAFAVDPTVNDYLFIDYIRFDNP
jgi:hypothetical protein